MSSLSPAGTVYLKLSFNLFFPFIFGWEYITLLNLTFNPVLNDQVLVYYNNITIIFYYTFLLFPFLHSLTKDMTGKVLFSTELSYLLYLPLYLKSEIVLLNMLQTLGVYIFCRKKCTVPVLSGPFAKSQM